jgi:hypothetical protein
VERDRLSTAVQQTHAVDSFARIAGRILGGLIVSFSGSRLSSWTRCLFDLVRPFWWASTSSADAASHQGRRAHDGRELTASFKVIYASRFCSAETSRHVLNLTHCHGHLLPVLGWKRAHAAVVSGRPESNIGVGAVVGALSVDGCFRACASTAS